MRVIRRLILTILLAAALPGCVREKPHEPDRNGLSGDLVVFHAGSLAVPLREVSALFQREHPGVTVKAEAAGSRDSARKISDLGRACDVLASADYQVVAELLIPKHADYNIRFAANEMAIAYTPRSKFAAQISADNWPEILARPGVALGRADPDRDPCGYRTVMVLQLAEKHYKLPGLADRLLAKDRRFVRPKETDLLALLESGEIDYFFIYRSVIQQHGLKMILLPAVINLGSPVLDNRYRAVSVAIVGRKPGETVTQRGEAIVYSVTIPRDAPNRAAAWAYVELLLSPRGQEILRASGQSPIHPAQVDHYDKLPEPLRPLCQAVK
jgi:molybdate/tungstate transport system substrate-binding protein